MTSTKDYTINLVSKNEGIKYTDSNGTFRFDVLLHNKIWEIYLPGVYGDNYEETHLTKEDEKIIIDRMTEYLKNIRWFGLFRRHYAVKVIRTK